MHGTLAGQLKLNRNDPGCIKVLCTGGAILHHLEKSGAGLECFMVLSACHFGKMTRIVVNLEGAYPVVKYTGPP